MVDINPNRQPNSEWNPRLRALDPRTPVDKLTELSRSKSTRIRASVAGNPSTTLSVLLRLSNDRSWEVRAGLAANEKLPQQLFTKLADDPEEWVRVNLARNPYTPFPVLLKLMRTPTSNVREAVKFTLIRIPDEVFGKKLEENGFTELTKLPREWAMKALFA